jgi:hypothetical protein
MPVGNEEPHDLAIGFRHPGSGPTPPYEARYFSARIRNPGRETRLVDLAEGLEVGSTERAEVHGSNDQRRLGPARLADGRWFRVTN